jgi:hypothetical protein
VGFGLGVEITVNCFFHSILNDSTEASTELCHTQRTSQKSRECCTIKYSPSADNVVYGDIDVFGTKFCLLNIFYNFDS